MRTLGLIAGKGELPMAIAKAATGRGIRVVVVALKPIADAPLHEVADIVINTSPGKLGAIIKALKTNGVTEAVMAGKVPKTLLFSRALIPDIRTVKFFAGLLDNKDDSILLALTRELQKDGIKLLDITEFAGSLLAPEGTLTKRAPTKKEWHDIRLGDDHRV